MNVSLFDTKKSIKKRGTKLLFDDERALREQKGLLSAI